MLPASTTLFAPIFHWLELAESCQMVLSATFPGFAETGVNSRPVGSMSPVTVNLPSTVVSPKLAAPVVVMSPRC